LNAIKGAIEEKFEGVEIDIQATPDGRIILLHDPVSEVSNAHSFPTLKEALQLLQNTKTLIILDLKSPLNELQIKEILDSGISPARLRLSAFNPEYLRPIKDEKLKTWNSISRYEHYRHPVFAKTEFHKSFHLFSAMVYGLFGEKDEHFAAWEVNYSFFLKMVLDVKPEFVVTKLPEECMALAKQAR
jgi:glycerophosphoryl diester phosphodiesterase